MSQVQKIALLVSSGLLLCTVVAVLFFKLFEIPVFSPATVLRGNFELGQYYFNQDNDPSGPYDLKKARKYYGEVIRDNSDNNREVWYQLGRIDFIEGKLGSAIYKFNKQLEYFGDEVPNVYYMLGLTYGYQGLLEEDREAWQKAEEAFLKFIEYAPTSPWPRVDLAWVYFSQGKFDEMVPVLEEGLAYEPGHAWLLNTYGLALLNTDRKEEARAQFRKAHEAAAVLTVEDWASAYSGNDPSTWKAGLEEFRSSIEHNLALVDS